MQTLGPERSSTPLVNHPPHIWVALVPHRLTDQEVAEFIDGLQITLGPENTLLELITVGCLVCEQPWRECHERPCPGEVPA